jgi:hypothetical protein
VHQKDAIKVRTKPFRVMGISLRYPLHIYNCLNGSLEPKTSVAKDIAVVFVGFGITDKSGPYGKKVLKHHIKQRQRKTIIKHNRNKISDSVN